VKARTSIVNNRVTYSLVAQEPIHSNLLLTSHTKTTSENT